MIIIVIVYFNQILTILIVEDMLSLCWDFLYIQDKKSQSC